MVPGLLAVSRSFEPGSAGEEDDLPPIEVIFWTSESREGRNDMVKTV
jgi:hypothetical protein